MFKNNRPKNNSLVNKFIYFMFNKRFLFLLCCACGFVLLTPLASLAAGDYYLLNDIPIKDNINIAKITQVLTILMLVSIVLERAIEIIVQALTLQEDAKKRWVPLVTFLLGILISLIGIRGLEPFFTVPKDGQGNLFRFMDVGLTGILISGGTAGIHKILTSLTAFLDVTKASSEKETQENKRIATEHEVETEKQKKVLATMRAPQSD
jgi:hypothetical protein